MNSVRLIRAAMATVFVGSAVASMASTIWAVDNLGEANAGTTGDRIIRFDSSDPVGTVTTIGSTGVGATLMGGLDFDGSNNLFSASQVAGGGQLFSINQTTGAATAVGNLNPGAGVSINDLSWNATMGMLGLGSSSNGPSLYSINLTTGAATLLGNVTGIPTGALVIGLASDSAGNNYIHDLATDQMYMLSGFTASAMSAPIGADTNFSQGMTIDQSNDSWFLGSLSQSTSFSSEVRAMNLSTGATSSILGTWGTNSTTSLPEFETGDLAIAHPVPEPATLAVVGLGLAAILKRRRNR